MKRLRPLRLEQLFLEEVTRVFQHDLADPALTGARVGAVSLSADHRALRVDFVCPDGVATREAVLAAAARAARHVRRSLADAIELDRVPEVRLVFHGFVAGGDA